MDFSEAYLELRGIRRNMEDAMSAEIKSFEAARGYLNTMAGDLKTLAWHLEELMKRFERSR